MRFTYATTLEIPVGPEGGEDTMEVDVCLHCTGTKGHPARIHYDEHDHPEEAAEIELDRFEIYDRLARRWRKPNLNPADFLNDCALEAAVDAWWDANSEQAWEGAED